MDTTRNLYRHMVYKDTILILQMIFFLSVRDKKNYIQHNKLAYLKNFIKGKSKNQCFTLQYSLYKKQFHKYAYIVFYI